MRIALWGIWGHCPAAAAVQDNQEWRDMMAEALEGITSHAHAAHAPADGAKPAGPAPDVLKGMLPTGPPSPQRGRMGGGQLHCCAHCCWEEDQINPENHGAAQYF